MATFANAFLAIYDQERIKHWALYIEADGYTSGVAIHVRGGMGTWSYGQDYTNPRDPETLAELVFICRMPISGVEELSEIAQDMTIPQDCAWNCQDYVIELVEELGLKGLLEDGWETGRDTIRRGKERHQ